MKHEELMKIEDSLQQARVFRNMVNPERTAHSDSYGTIVNFDSLYEWMKDNPTSSLLLECIDYWMTNPNVGYTLRLVALTLQRRAKNEQIQK